MDRRYATWQRRTPVPQETSSLNQTVFVESAYVVADKQKHYGVVRTEPSLEGGATPPSLEPSLRPREGRIRLPMTQTQAESFAPIDATVLAQSPTGSNTQSKPQRNSRSKRRAKHTERFFGSTQGSRRGSIPTLPATLMRASSFGRRTSSAPKWLALHAFAPLWSPKILLFPYLFRCSLPLELVPVSDRYPGTFPGTVRRVDLESQKTG
uniref:Uncharacterized protein n=1 Tax=Coccidioides posadasii RMSCC 3488 TaxID=454284 RepID=A0A0J6FPD8_COCPO|nr:hypothetical protein CPAG_07617 [Coccidioides posadasii RMSCC 3488]